MACVTYASVVGSLMYVMVCTRIEIAHAVGVLRRYMSTPKKEHWTIVKRVFRYFWGTKDYAIYYQGKPVGDSGKLDVHVFFVADWAEDLDRRKSTIRYVFKMFNGAISWMRKRQAVVSLLKIEVEYMEATHGIKEAVWIQMLCS